MPTPPTPSLRLASYQVHPPLHSCLPSGSPKSVLPSFFLVTQVELRQVVWGMETLEEGVGAVKA